MAGTAPIGLGAPPRFARNLTAVLAWELLWGFGAACTSSSIFVPFLSRLEGSKRLVGTVGLTTLLGIPALFVSLWLAHRLRSKKLAVTLLFAAQVVGWIVLHAALLGRTRLSASIVSHSLSIQTPPLDGIEVVGCGVP
jgi:hypothetical protein